MNKDRKWTSGPNDPGILRKKEDGTDTELLVFGYACKLFRDDQKASEIDRGTHLINWMGQESLKVDRYDARGHLSELSMYETSESYVLTPEEKRVEQLCDEERYRALYSNEDENQLYQEEEFKRLRQALNQDNEYGQVAYSYTEKNQEGTQSVPESVEQEEQFIPNPMLDIPFGLDLPETNKQHVIIEKTAMMINSHGSQMEFLLKVKQGSNAKFSFLHSTDRLNSYYNYLREQIKTGKYKPQITSSDNEQQTNYLHPSLVATPQVESAPSISIIPSIAYKPSDDCAYNQLVNKIRTVQKSQELTEPNKPTPTIQKNMEPPPKVIKIIDSLIKYCKRNGLNIQEFANRLPRSDQNTSFRYPENEYHSYWLTRLLEAQESSFSHADANIIENCDMQDISTPSNYSEQNGEINSSTSPSAGVVLSLNPVNNLYEDDSSSSSEESEQQPIEIGPLETTAIDANYIHANGSLPKALKSYILADQNMLNTSVAPLPRLGEPGPIASSTPMFQLPKPPKPAPVCFSIKNKKEEKLETSSALHDDTESDEEEESEVEAKEDSVISTTSSNNSSGSVTSTKVKSFGKESTEAEQSSAKKKFKTEKEESSVKKKIKSEKSSPQKREGKKKSPEKKNSSKSAKSSTSSSLSRKTQKIKKIDSNASFPHNTSPNSGKGKTINKLVAQSPDDLPIVDVSPLKKDLGALSREKSADQLKKMEQRRKRLREFKMKMAAKGNAELKTDGYDKIKRLKLKSTDDNSTVYGPELEIVDATATGEDESHVSGDNSDAKLVLYADDATAIIRSQNFGELEQSLEHTISSLDSQKIHKGNPIESNVTKQELKEEQLLNTSADSNTGFEDSEGESWTATDSMISGCTSLSGITTLDTIELPNCIREQSPAMAAGNHGTSNMPDVMPEATNLHSAGHPPSPKLGMIVDEPNLYNSSKVDKLVVRAISEPEADLNVIEEKVAGAALRLEPLECLFKQPINESLSRQKESPSTTEAQMVHSSDSEETVEGEAHLSIQELAVTGNRVTLHSSKDLPGPSTVTKRFIRQVVNRAITSTNGNFLTDNKNFPLFCRDSQPVEISSDSESGSPEKQKKHKKKKRKSGKKAKVKKSKKKKSKYGRSPGRKYDVTICESSSSEFEDDDDSSSTISSSSEEERRRREKRRHKEKKKKSSKRAHKKRSHRHHQKETVLVESSSSD